MSLNALVLCSDEKIVRVLRRTLGDLEIGVEVCADADHALRKLTRQRFEAIVVDCADARSADVLRSARSALCNKRAVAVAVVEPATGLRSAFDLGAHFVLYKPVSTERAKSSFRAARALMKRERRRNFRVPVQIPVLIRKVDSDATLQVNTVDLSEGGMAVRIPGRRRPTGLWNVSFTLPGTTAKFELSSQFAWEGNMAQAGLRFVDVAPDAARKLMDWLKVNSPETEPDDPPVTCRLTDLSLGACYLTTASPFPRGTRVILSIKTGDLEVHAGGVVLVAHPEFGMGVEFLQTTIEQRDQVRGMITTLRANGDKVPELLVEPEGLESMPEGFAKFEIVATHDSGSESSGTNEISGCEDSLVDLFRHQYQSPVETFLQQMREQRQAVESHSR